MRNFTLSFVLILSSINYTGAQDASERRCDACARAGLELFMWDMQHESVMTDGGGRIVKNNFEGRVYLHFRNSGSTDWRVERVSCHFLDRAQQSAVQSFDGLGRISGTP